MKIPPYDSADRRSLGPLGERVSALIRVEVGRSRREALRRAVEEGAPYEERLDPDRLAQLVVEELEW